MSHEFVARRLDIRAFAAAGGVLSGQEPLAVYERLLAEVDGRGADRRVAWQVRGELHQDASGYAQVWLRLQAQACLPLVCQRCLGPADIDVFVERSFRFVATEAEAEAEDEAAEEDVLVLSREFDLHALIEDELLMALPLVPRHDICPTPVKLAVQDADFEAAEATRPKPFAALAGLKGGPQDRGRS